MNDYKEVRAAAQAAANKDGYDRGLEILGGSYRFFLLPSVGSRQGHELLCEVVSCEIRERCAKGHGPEAVDPNPRPTYHGAPWGPSPSDSLRQGIGSSSRGRR